MINFIIIATTYFLAISPNVADAQNVENPPNRDLKTLNRSRPPMESKPRYSYSRNNIKPQHQKIKEMEKTLEKQRLLIELQAKKIQSLEQKIAALKKAQQ